MSDILVPAPSLTLAIALALALCPLSESHVVFHTSDIDIERRI